jgi:hypothetical protein
MYHECRHIMPSGSRCHSPALRNTHFCFFHTRLHRSIEPKSKFADQSLQLPVIEDASSVQIALNQVLSALGSGQLEPRRAGLLLYGLQIAAQITARSKDHKPSEIVRSLSNESEGAALAPEPTVCEPPMDCHTCSAKDTCVSLTRTNSKSIKRLLTAIARKQKNWDDEAVGTPSLSASPSSPRQLVEQAARSQL